MTREAWVARANEILDDLRHMLAGLGISVAKELRVVADAHPCPGYVHDACTIGFCPPAIASRVDALRWAFFAKAMGCANVEAAARFYDVALPFVIAHETSHHLRMSMGRHDRSHFVEEQACDKLAAALVRASPRYAATLGPLRAECEAMRESLAATFADGPIGAFVPDATDMIESDADTRAKLAELRAITAREGLSFAAMALLVPEVSPDRVERAEEKRGLAQRHLDLHYARDPAEYWFASVVWLSRYLGAPGQPSLAEVLDTYLTGMAGTDAATIDALTSALRGDDPVVVEGAAAALLDRFGADVMHDLVDELARRADGDPATTVAIVRVLARSFRPAWDASAVARLVRSPVDPASMHHVLRLARVAAVDPSPLLPAARALAASHGDARRSLVATELAAIEGDALAIAAMLERTTEDGDRVGPLLAALVAYGRKLGPDVALPTALPVRGSPRWEALVAVFAGPRPRDEKDSLRRAAFVADVEQREAARDASVRALAWRMVEEARAARAALDSLVTTSATAELASFAEAIVERVVRRAAVEVATMLTPSAHRVTKAELVPTVLRAASVPRVLVDLLLADLGAVDPDAASDGDAPAPRAIDLAPFFSPRPGTSRVALPFGDRDALFDPVERAALARANRAIFPGYEETPAMATLLDRMLCLRRVSLFAGLSAERLSDLAHVTLERRFAAGDTIVRAGERGDELYLLVEGEVRLVKDGDDGAIELAVLRSPAFFGEMTLFDDHPRSATAIATTPCVLLSIDGDAVRRVGRRHPEIYEGLLALLSQRVRASSKSLAR